MRTVLEFWLSLSRSNRIAVDCLLFWLAAGGVLGLGAMGGGLVREMTIPFLFLTVLAGTAGALVATVESIHLFRGLTRIPQDEFDLRQLNHRNLRLAVLLAAANAFPAFVLGLALIRGIRLFA